MLESYFVNREANFNISNLLRNKNQLAVTSNELSKDEIRLALISKLEEKLNITIKSADNSYTIVNTITEGNLTYLDLYEWTNVDYTGSSGLIDTFGYGVSHKMIFQTEITGSVMLSDEYDEGPLTGMSSSLTQNKFNKLISEKYENDESKVTNQNLNILSLNNAALISNTAATTITLNYSRSGAAYYADTYVSHVISGTYTTQYYAPMYRNFAPNPGDCANYVSQCLCEGGKLRMKSGSWYYNFNNTAVTSDDTCTTAWNTAPDLRIFLKNNYGTVIGNPVNSDIKTGDALFVKWHSTNSNYNHAFICVGYNSSGVPIINSHTDDYYHIPWKYGYSDSVYSCVHIKDSIIITV